MARKLVLAGMLAIVFIGVLFAVISLLGKNESVKYDTSYVWHTATEGENPAVILERGKNLDMVRKEPAKLVTALNLYVEESETARPAGDGVKTEFPRITLQKVEQQVAHIEVINDQYLTQKMGSLGAQDFLAIVTYTLTENPGITSVNFQFQAGEHAMPGVYSRQSFTGYTLKTGGGK